LFILGSLVERGPMHGHAIRMLAEEEHIDQWADFGAGAIYGAIKRLAADGLIAELRVEREGNYPERQVYDVTAEGRQNLDELRRHELDTIVYRPDPVDLALARLDPDALDELEGTVRTRLAELRSRLQESEVHVIRIAHYLTLMEQQVMRHKAHRLRGEIAWHEQLLAALPEIITDEKARRGNPS
jgi:DNA-binding PadR family transcriptional regulator